MVNDINISNSVVYKVLIWNYANDNTKLLEQKKEITRNQVCEILYRMNRVNASINNLQDHLINHFINNKLTIQRMYLYIDKYLIKQNLLKKYTVKEELNKAYVFVSFDKSYIRFYENLIHINNTDKITKRRSEKIKKELIRIEGIIKIVKKKL